MGITNGGQKRREKCKDLGLGRVERMVEEKKKGVSGGVGWILNEWLGKKGVGIGNLWMDEKKKKSGNFFFN